MKKFAAVLAGVLITAAPAFAQAPTDAEIAAIVVTANQVDIDAGKLASTKATNAEVKAFAERMVVDHTGVNTAAGELAAKLKLTPKDNATAQSLKAGGKKNITTLEGLPEWYAARRGLRRAPALHPVQQAPVDEQAPQCGYCMNGVVIKAAELLATAPRPSDDQIRAALDGHLCRCGAYPSILRAIRKAADA